MFIGNEDSVDISIFYRKFGKTYKCYDYQEFEKIDKEEQQKYIKLNIKARVLTWEMFNTLQAIAKDNYKSFKENKLKKVIIKWDAKKDNNGVQVDVPLTEDSIMCLSPNVAETILKAYDAVMFINDDEEKNIAKDVYAYVMGKGRHTSAISKSIIENDLIEEFHWLPQQIAEIPYRKLQEFFIVRREKTQARNAKIGVEKFKAEQNSAVRGQTKRPRVRR